MGEACFVLRTAKGEATSFRVEARVRPVAPRGAVYDRSRTAGSCVASWSEVSGKPLIAQSAIDRLVLQTVHINPPASVFVREGARITRCTGLAEVHPIAVEIVLGRTPVTPAAPARAGLTGAACQKDAECQSHDCASHRCAAPRAGPKAAPKTP